MRRMILRMIATGSLSAFSAAALQGPQALGGSAGVQPARFPKLSGSAAQPATGSAQPLPQTAAPKPGQTLPRGSLLDLSV